MEREADRTHTAATPAGSDALAPAVLPAPGRHLAFSDALRTLSAGFIVGIGAVIYAMSYGAMLFAGPLAPHIGYAMSAALITATLGVLVGLFSQERTLVSGPDSNTVSVMASMAAAVGALGLAPAMTLQIAVGAIILASLACAAVFFALSTFRVTDVVRYVPHPVMAGFLAATGWVMASSALNVAAGVPLTVEGLSAFVADPVRPSLLFCLLVAAALWLLGRRLPMALLLPASIVTATALIHLFVSAGFCGNHCAADLWFFPRQNELRWLPPWSLRLTGEEIHLLFEQLPTMLVVAFVGLLSMLLSLASLELSYRREFDLDRALRTHAALAGVSALLGGFVTIISIGRTYLNRHAGGGAAAAIIAAAICLSVLLGADQLVAVIPRAALGGVVLFLGTEMLKEWLWEQRKTASRAEMAEIFLILILIANFGYVTGFFAGVVISCLIFAATYSQVPLVRLATDLSMFRSSVLRPHQHVETLRNHGQRVLLFRLGGYVFFGSAAKLDKVFAGVDLDAARCVIVDFSRVTGIDRSALGVFERVLLRHEKDGVRFYLVHGNACRRSLLSLCQPGASTARPPVCFDSLDHALESAEELLLQEFGRVGMAHDSLEFLESAGERDAFRAYCRLRHFAPGEPLCHKGDQSDEVFFVTEGCLEVIDHFPGGVPRRLAKLNAGAIAGEMAFYTGEPRTASIIALTAASVLVLEREALARMQNAQPELASKFDRLVIRKLAEALRRSNNLLAAVN